MLKIGDKAIGFSLPDSYGVVHNLSDYLGKKVVLYFYPKDNTSGCTNQALEFKRLFDEFSNENAVVIGISKDSISSHCKFQTKYDLPFILLSDVECDIIAKYGVYQEKSMYGRKYMGVVRTTYIIDENGVISGVYEKVSANKNPQEMLDLILGR